MHFEFLVEGSIENTTLSSGILTQILGEYNQPHTWKIHPHRGIGRLPDDLTASPNRNDNTLLHNLPAKLRAYGKENSKQQVIIVLLDLDDRPDCIAFKHELEKILTTCNPCPKVFFRIAIEELEAWFLGDQAAIQTAYPDAKLELLQDYQQDSICGTWEKLAEVVHPGGLKALQSKGKGKRSPVVLQEKRKWAARIAPQMNVQHNHSPSFCCFRDKLAEWT